jgi:peptidoglycan/xylan/chitin deacetylase (PgdA/CDA1 family)
MFTGAVADHLKRLMRLGLKANRFVFRTDQLLSCIQLHLVERKGSLLSVFFHGIFSSRDECELDLCYPQQRTTVGHLDRTIQYFRDSGCQFVTPQDILDGLDPHGRYVLLTFDDGYYNNIKALPVLEKHDVPALFFVVAGLVETGQAFWWDVLYRARRAQNVPRERVCAEIGNNVAQRSDVLEQWAKKEANVSELKPVGDVDRVFTALELRALAAHPLVYIGNHSWTHDYLPVYTDAEISKNIAHTQERLETMTGKNSLAIAYPYGATSPGVLHAAASAGLKLGFTTQARKNYLPATRDPRACLSLGRFVVWGDLPIPPQCCRMRSDLMLHYRYEQGLRKVKNWLGKTVLPNQ